MHFARHQGIAHFMRSAFPLRAIWQVVLYALHFFFGFTGLAVFAAALKSPALGAFLLPTLFMRSPEPALMRLRFAAMFAYNPLPIISSISPLRPKMLPTSYPWQCYQRDAP